ncbi:hypothetical protein NEOLEDRAFT_1175152 [Neolentinus lepideus HHB14362 ss-1]|uniref:XRRM domain-containing protein n=1 Tax=Neolentinus lepideus HHB14362 ss-1 TaxID=1314782 RepID=A0A165VC68_9AGAM|nr:hypothetical protein NEOLEDRAFT_1175152 [Neolentinus lepideus HHB14362 ss-1]
MSSSFPFIPRKVAKAGKVTTSASSSRTNTIPLAAVAVVSNAGGPSRVEHAPATAKGKGKQKDTDRASAEEDYATLVCLSLSDYALWSNPELRMAVESHLEGFVPLNDLMYHSPYFSNLSSTSEAILAKAIRTHTSDTLEVRMVVSEPAKGNWYKRGISNVKDVGGGYEVRRKDWENAVNLAGTMTKDVWDGLTVYVENIPVRFRSIAGIVRFIQALLHPETSLPTYVQHISLPGHDSEAKCKGFALVTLSAPEGVVQLINCWPWQGNGEKGLEEEEKRDEIREARRLRMRCMSKKRWEEMGREYVAHRARLLEQVAGHQDAANNFEDSEASGCKHSPSPSVQTASSLPDYPEGCLVFVRNVHPSTNKTTLRTLFSTAFANSADADGIDYVDFNKGLNACYLRLKAPNFATQLVAHFTSHQTAQSDGLDSTGTQAPDKGKAIQVDLVTGTREEMYWGKVPEKVRREVVARMHSQPAPQVSRDTMEPKTTSPRPQATKSKATATLLQSDYPQRCLVFVRNVHPSTNKTTLRTLFSSAFDEGEEGIHYIDFTKGMDTCHLRLKSPALATRLVSRFTSHPTVQIDGLDGIGTQSSQTSNIAKTIGVELVTGTREEMYWGKVPEKVRREAAVASAAVETRDREDEEEERNLKKRWRRK